MILFCPHPGAVPQLQTQAAIGAGFLKEPAPCSVSRCPLVLNPALQINPEDNKYFGASLVRFVVFNQFFCVLVADITILQHRNSSFTDRERKDIRRRLFIFA